MESGVTLSDCSIHDSLHQHDSTTAGTCCNENDASAEHNTPEPRYFHDGIWYESIDDLVDATRDKLRFASPGEISGASFQQSANHLYRQYKNEDNDGQGLKMHEFKGLAASLAADLGMDPQKFGDFGKIFHRFDINADGKVDEEECVLLTKAIFRHFHYSLHPGAPGGSKLLNLEVKDMEAHYTVLERVGQGGQGTVFIAQERCTRRGRVIKMYDKKNPNAPLDEIKHEFVLLKSLDHPKVQRLYDIFEDAENVYVVAEPYRGGDLRDVVDKGMDAGINVTTSWIAKIMIQVMQGVAYLHGKYVIHCDLKEANVMIATDDNWREPAAVIIDFGMARNFVVDGDSGGTAGYMPPEVWKYRLWTAMGDVFALGVVMFQIFANGEKCFKGPSKQDMERATCERPPNFEAIHVFWRRNGLDLVPLLESMLQKDFRRRPTIKQCMEDTFFEKRLARDLDEEGLSEHVVSALCNVSDQNWWDLRHAFSSVIAARLNLLELRDLNAAFEAIDVNHDGFVSEEEMRKALGWHMEAEHVENIVRSLVGGNGQVPYSVFMGQLLASQAADCTDFLRHEFQQLDRSKKGRLSRGDVTQLLERPEVSQVLGLHGTSSIMALLDLDGDDCVSFDEFCRALGGSGVGKDMLSVECLKPHEAFQFAENHECNLPVSNAKINNHAGLAETHKTSISSISKHEECDSVASMDSIPCVAATRSNASMDSIPCVAAPRSNTPRSSTPSCESSNSRLKGSFKAIDHNSDGKLSFDELFALLRKGDATFDEHEALRLFRAIDQNANGEIEFNEFVDYIYDNEEFSVKVEAERVAFEEEREAKVVVLSKSLQVRAEASKTVLWSGGDWRKLRWKERLRVIIDIESSGQEKTCWA